MKSLVGGHILLLEAARVDDLLGLVDVDVVHFVADLGLISFDDAANVGNVEVVVDSLAICHAHCLILGAGDISSEFQVAVRLGRGADHLEEDGGGDPVADLAVLLPLEVHGHHVDRVPGARSEGAPEIGQLLLHEEAPAEASDLGVEQVDRGKGRALVEVQVRVPLEDIIELLLEGDEVAGGVDGLSVGSLLGEVPVGPRRAVGLPVTVVLALQELTPVSRVNFAFYKQKRFQDELREKRV